MNERSKVGFCLRPYITLIVQLLLAIYIYILYGKTFFAFRFLNQKLKYPFLEGHPVPFYMEGATPPPPPPSFIPRRGYQVVVVVVKGGNYVTNASFHSKEDRMFGIH